MSITEWEMHITAQPPPRLRNNLYCVEWDVKLYYTVHSPNALVYLSSTYRQINKRMLNVVIGGKQWRCHTRVTRVLRADREKANTSGATEHAHEERSRTHHRGSRLWSNKSGQRTTAIASKSIRRQSTVFCCCAQLFFAIRRFPARISSILNPLPVYPAGATFAKSMKWSTF